MSKEPLAKCEVCQERDIAPRKSAYLCDACFSNGVRWAAQEAFEIAKPPPPPPECVHEWLQFRGGKRCHKCDKVVTE